MYRGGNTTARARSERKHCARCRNFASRPVSFIDHRPTQFVSIDTNLLSKLGHSVYLLLPSFPLFLSRSLDLLPSFHRLKSHYRERIERVAKHSGMLEIEPPHNARTKENSTCKLFIQPLFTCLIVFIFSALIYFARSVTITDFVRGSRERN